MCGRSSQPYARAPESVRDLVRDGIRDGTMDLRLLPPFQEPKNVFQHQTRGTFFLVLADREAPVFSGDSNRYLNARLFLGQREGQRVLMGEADVAGLEASGEAVEIEYSPRGNPEFLARLTIPMGEGTPEFRQIAPEFQLRSERLWDPAEESPIYDVLEELGVRIEDLIDFPELGTPC